MINSRIIVMVATLMIEGKNTFLYKLIFVGILSIYEIQCVDLCAYYQEIPIS